MAEEVLEENIPDTIISNGKTLREEVILEQARRITGIVPEPVDNKILDRLNDLEGTLDALLGGE